MEKLRFLNTSKNNNNVKLYSHLKYSSIKNKTGEISNVLSVSNKLGFIKQEDQFENRVVASKDTTNYKVVKTNDYAYNPARINVGSIARLKFHDIGIVSPMYVVFATKKSLNRDFFDNFLQSQKFNNQLKKKLVGSVRQTLDFKSMSDIILDLPDLIEQEKIGGFLSSFDKLIQKQQEKIFLLKEFKKGYMQKIFNKYSNQKQVSIFQASERIVSGRTPNQFDISIWNGLIPWITSTKIHEKFISSSLLNLTEDGVRGNGLSIIPKNSILVATAGQGKTRGTVATNEVDLCTNDAMLSIIPKNEYYYLYIMYFLEYSYNRLRLLNPQDTKTRLSTKLLGEFKISNVEYSIQVLIGDYFQKIDRLISLNQTKLERIEDLKKGYIQRLF